MSIPRRFKRHKKAEKKGRSSISDAKPSSNAKATRERMAERIKKSEHLSKYNVISPPPGVEKMSEVIHEFARPLLEKFVNDSDSGSDMAFWNIITLAVLVWNTTLLPKDKQKDSIADIITGIPHSTDEELQMLKAMIGLLMIRKQKLFPDNRRLVLDYEIAITDNMRNLLITSSMDQSENDGQSE